VAAVAGVAVGDQSGVGPLVDVVAGDLGRRPHRGGGHEVVPAGQDLDAVRPDQVSVGGVDVDGDPAVSAEAGAAQDIHDDVGGTVRGGQRKVGGVVAVGVGGAVRAGGVAPGVGLGGVVAAVFVVPGRHAVGGEQVHQRRSGPDQRRSVRDIDAGLDAGAAVLEAGHGVFGQREDIGEPEPHAW
jgi:hypothetical protein